LTVGAGVIGTIYNRGHRRGGILRRHGWRTIATALCCNARDATRPSASWQQQPMNQPLQHFAQTQGCSST
jgi:hypothetical protein